MQLLTTVLVALYTLVQCRQETNSPSPDVSTHSNSLVITAKEAQKLALAGLSTPSGATSK